MSYFCKRNGEVYKTLNDAIDAYCCTQRTCAECPLSALFSNDDPCEEEFIMDSDMLEKVERELSLIRHDGPTEPAPDQEQTRTTEYRIKGPLPTGAVAKIDRDSEVYQMCRDHLADIGKKRRGEPVTGKKSMAAETFNRLVDELRTASFDTLITKNNHYGNEDKLHNFRAGAEFIGGTPAQAAWGYMTKHLVSLQDKVLKNDFSNRDDLLEKCQDIINYTIFIWCCGNEEAGE